MFNACGVLLLAFTCTPLLESTSSSLTPAPSHPEIQSLQRQSYALIQAGRPLDAIVALQRGLRLSTGAADTCSAAWFLNGLAGTYFGLYRYRDALATYQEEKPWAERCGDPTNLGILYGNIASLYTATGTGDLNAAAQAARDALNLLQRREDRPFRASILITRARIDAKLRNLDQSIAGFKAAVEEAARSADPADRQNWAGAVRTQATAWKELGEAMLAEGRYAAAEEALDNAYRLQVLNGIPPSAVTYRLLAELRRVRGDLPAASRLIDRAIEQAISLGPRVPMWRLYYERGRIRLARNEPNAALRDFETSLDFIRRFRIEFLPADSFRISNENYLHDVYWAYVNTCNQLLSQRTLNDCALKSFEVAEENRAVSLRTILLAPEDWRRTLDDRYLSQLNELETTERALLRKPTPELQAHAAHLHSQLTDQELKAGIRSRWLQPVPAGEVLSQCRRSLRDDEALLSFALGDERSYLWTVTRSRVVLHRLAPRADLEALGRQFRDEVRSSSPEAVETGEKLYRRLYGQVGLEVARRNRWILVLDQDLFHLPHAALVAGRSGGRPVYLIEKHSLQQLPAAAMLASRLDSGHNPGSDSGRFVTVGDAVYNRADKRWTGKPAVPQSPVGWFGASFAGESNLPLELPRLPGSGREIDACARVWRTDSPVLTLSGMDASPARLDEVLREPVSVLHIAAHFLSRQGASRETQIALSLDPAGQLRFLSEREIYSRRVSVHLVVLSGCSSGNGYALPASGLLGMTRAWLAAGAHSVAASLWPTTDDAGEIFTQFYRNLHSLRLKGVTEPEPVALQRAQLALLKSQTWRKSPAYWAAYSLVMKD